jgi:hypothetical protein
VLEIICGGVTYRWRVTASNTGDGLGDCPITTAGATPNYASDGLVNPNPAATGINPNGC